MESTKNEAKCNLSDRNYPTVFSSLKITRGLIILACQCDDFVELFKVKYINVGGSSGYNCN